MINDPFAVSIYNKVENGTLRMCSAGLLPVELSNDPDAMVPGQTLPTMTKSILKEVSIVDIGSNPEALFVALYDDKNKLTKLADTHIKDALLKLSAKSNAPTELERLSAKPFNVLFNSDGLARLKELSFDAYAEKFKEHFGRYPENKPADKKTNDVPAKSIKLSNEDSEVMALSSLLALAENTGKLNESESAFIIKQVVGNKDFDSVKTIIRLKQGSEINLIGKYKQPFFAQYVNLSYDQVEKKPGGMRLLEERWPEMYQMKFFEKNGRMPKVLKK